MKREIKFRGLRADGKGWVYGCFVKSGFNSFIVYDATEDDYRCAFDNVFIPVIQESVGQFTGLKDKNGVDIYEGDKFKGDEYGEYYVISWNEKEAVFQADLYGYNVSYGEGSQEIYADEVTCIDTNCFELSSLTEDEVTGNIHENPELPCQ